MKTLLRAGVRPRLISILMLAVSALTSLANAQTIDLNAAVAPPPPSITTSEGQQAALNIVLNSPYVQQMIADAQAAAGTTGTVTVTASITVNPIIENPIPIPQTCEHGVPNAEHCCECDGCYTPPPATTCPHGVGLGDHCCECEGCNTPPPTSQTCSHGIPASEHCCDCAGCNAPATCEHGVPAGDHCCDCSGCNNPTGPE